MTSNEALEKLLHLHICYDCTAEKDCCKTCDSRLCYEAVKKDLEVLEILKKHLYFDEDKSINYEEICTYSKLKSNSNGWQTAFCNFSGNANTEEEKEAQEDFALVKEWLENGN